MLILEREFGGWSMGCEATHEELLPFEDAYNRMDEAIHLSHQHISTVISEFLSLFQQSSSFLRCFHNNARNSYATRSLRYEQIERDCGK